MGSLLQAAPGAKRRESRLGKQKTHIFTTNTDAAPLPGHRLSGSQSRQRSHGGAGKARKGENGGGGGWGRRRGVGWVAGGGASLPTSEYRPGGCWYTRMLSLLLLLYSGFISFS